MRLSNIIVLISLLYINNSYSQYTDIINSNRPGASKSAFAVGENVKQIEGGTLYSIQKHDVYNSNTNGLKFNTEGRYGIGAEELELNLDLTFSSFSTKNSVVNESSNFTGLENFSIGAKYLVFDPYKKRRRSVDIYSFHSNRKIRLKDLIPAVGVYAGVNYDNKENPFLYNPKTSETFGGISPKIALYTQNNFESGYVFITNFQYNRIGSDIAEFQYILTLTKALNERFMVLIETQGFKSEIYDDTLYRFGSAYLLSDNLQIDGSLAFNVTNTPSVFNLNFGISYRFGEHKEDDIQTKDNIDKEYLENELDKEEEKKLKKLKKEKQKELKKQKREEDYLSNEVRRQSRRSETNFEIK